MEQKRGVVNQVAMRLRHFAKGQRSMLTRAETLFWQQVRGGRFNGYKFKRQVPIAPYIVDFLCAGAKVIIELDGEPHESPERQMADFDRDCWLREQGFVVLRFRNDRLLGNCDRVLAEVKQAIDARLAPSPAPLRGAPPPAKGQRGARMSVRASA
jgi:very-short-patch-repair endonuclease